MPTCSMPTERLCATMLFSIKHVAMTASEAGELGAEQTATLRTQ